MKSLYTKFPQVLLASLLGLALFSTLSTQTAQAFQIKTFFDSFNYNDNGDSTYTQPGEVLGLNTWTAEHGESSSAIADTAWYEWDWCTQNTGKAGKCKTQENAAIRIITDPSDSQNRFLRLQASAGYRTIFKDSEASLGIASGFTAKTGLWAVRIRFDDIKDEPAQMMQSFWPMSPYRAKLSTDPDTSFWSEINHEWNNFFCDDLDKDGDLDPEVFCNLTPRPAFHFDATGIRRDAEGSGKITMGGFPMSNPLKPSDPTHPEFVEFSCYKLLGTNNFTSIDNPHECIRYFLEDLHGNGNQFVDLMIKHDGATVQFGAASRTFGTGLVYMEHTHSFVDDRGYTWRPQPLSTHFSQLTRWKEGGLPNNDELSQQYNLDLDWFYYSSNTSQTFWQMLSAVDGVKHHDRFVEFENAVGRLAAPNGTTPLSVIMEGPLTAPVLTEEKWEFTATPSPIRDTQDYRILWRHRMRTARGSWDGPNSVWGNWSNLYETGFSNVIDLSGDTDGIEVMVYINDFRKTGEGWATDCMLVTRAALQDLDESFPADCGAPPSGLPASPNSIPRATEANTGLALHEQNISTAGLPQAFALLPSYPNPFNPSTTISFALPEAALAEVTIYDVLGKEVGQLVNERREAGTHQVTWDAAGLPSGLYLVQFKADAFQAAQTLMLVK